MARSVLTLLALTLLAAAALRTTVPPLDSVAPGQSDFDTFRAVVDRVRAGEPYYEAMGMELRSRGYPTSRAFNWRTPFHLRTLALGPDALARIAMGALLVLLCAVTARVVRRPFAAAWVTSTALQAGVVLIVAAPSLVLLGESWAGVLIGISVCVYVRGRPIGGAALGLLALFVRELSAPYCAACTVIAAYHRRWRELALWGIGACAYAVYYGLHLAHVWAAQVPADAIRERTWLTAGGLPFLLTTVRWAGWPFVLPDAALAVTLVLIVAGVANPRAPVHVRASSAAYMTFFLLAGQPFNHYWGLMAAPTWAVASGYGVEGIAQALRTVAKRGEIAD
jgi:hypothetical protein